MRTSYRLGGRVYVTPNGYTYPSVTTILANYNKEAIAAWRAKVGEEEANRIVKESSGRGSRFHSLCEKYLLNQLDEQVLSEAADDARQLFEAVKPVIDKSVGNVYCMEQTLYSDRLKIAGRVDLIADWNGVPAVIDFKNSLKTKKEEWITNYLMQCTCYTCMFSEITGLPLNQIVVLIGVVDNPIPQVFVKKATDYLEETVKFIRDYHAVN